MLFWDFGVTMVEAEGKNNFGLPFSIDALNRTYQIDLKFSQFDTTFLTSVTS